MNSISQCLSYINTDNDIFLYSDYIYNNSKSLMFEKLVLSNYSQQTVTQKPNSNLNENSNQNSNFTVEVIFPFSVDDQKFLQIKQGQLIHNCTWVIIKVTLDISRLG